MIYSKTNWEHFIFNIIFIQNNKDTVIKLAGPGTQCCLCPISLILQLNAFILSYKLC